MNELYPQSCIKLYICYKNNANKIFLLLYCYLSSLYQFEKLNDFKRAFVVNR
jgi:hypothetical protein